MDEFIPHISDVPIGGVLTNRILDPAIGKYFILAQYSIQYLLFCKQFLDETVVEIRNSVADVQRHNLKLEKLCKKRNDEIVNLTKKLQNSQKDIFYPCTKCTKNFISHELLQAHLNRKHFEDPKAPEKDSNLINTIKLELEVKQLKERLNVAEKDLHRHDRALHEPNSGSSSLPVQEFKKTVEKSSVAIQSDEFVAFEKEVQTYFQEPERPQTPQISKEDLANVVKSQQIMFEEWKNEERKKFQNEISEMKHNFEETFKNIEKKEKSPSNLQVPQMKLANEDQNLWKMRCHEMEKMYQDSQKQMNETVSNMENVYANKMKEFEKFMEKTKHEMENKKTYSTRQIQTVEVEVHQGRDDKISHIVEAEVHRPKIVPKPHIPKPQTVKESKVEKYSPILENTEDESSSEVVQEREEPRKPSSPPPKAKTRHQTRKYLSESDENDDNIEVLHVPKHTKKHKKPKKRETYADQVDLKKKTLLVDKEEM